MLPPYQFLRKCGGVLFAATSSRVDSFNIDDGSWLSSWTCPIPLEGHSYGNSQLEDFNVTEPPAKRKLSDSQNEENPGNGKARGSSNRQHDATTGIRKAPAVIALGSTRLYSHVIIVTAEDKSIRVFEHNEKGHLRHISQRNMPKRICAIAVTPDDSTIICADKFGDVYSIPLLFSHPLAISDDQESDSAASLVPRSCKPFVPAANDLTVHSIRNRKALQNQMRQKHNTSEKAEPHFEHKLLLGHVSMLADIVLAERYGENYIITADRDEHIRISRGIPQAHVIEGYCLGHKEFVSRVCMAVERPDLLISGGGDDYIFVWNWPLRKLLHKVNLRHYAQKAIVEARRASHDIYELDGHSTSPSEATKVAVSRIKYMKRALDQQNDLILVACEGIPALFIFSLLADSNLVHYQNLALQGNPLDLVTDSGSNRVFVSIDNAHQPGSTHQLRSELDPTVQPLQTFQMTEPKCAKTPFQFDIRPVDHPSSERSKVCNRDLSSLLYPIEKLRKIGAED